MADAFLDQVQQDYSTGDRKYAEDRHRSSRHRSRSPRDRSSHHHSSRRDEEDSYRSSRRNRDEYDSRSGSHRSSHSHRDDRSSRGRYDDYNDPPPPRRRDDYGMGGGGRSHGYDDRRGGGSYGAGGGGGGGGGGRDDRRGGNAGGGRGAAGSRGRGGAVFEGFAEQGRRSPTPENVLPISKRVRKFTAWDVKPPGFENYTAEQAKMTGMFNLPGQARPQLPVTGFGIDGNPPLFFKGGAVNGAVGPGAPIGSLARQSRRLYVGNITTDATEESLAYFFNSKMAEANLLSEKGLGEDLLGLGLTGDQPVISVHLNYEKNYAFVEFRNAEEATNAMGFDGIIFQNSALKVRRPKDYQGGENEQAPHVPGVISTNVPDTINKIFIGGLPSYLNDDQVMELLKSFGELRSFNLVKEGGTGQSKGFAFCEYVDPSVTEVACAGLNGMELGDRLLVVQRAALGANRSNTLNNLPGLENFAGQQQNQNNSNIIPPTSITAGAAADAQPTRVLQILNMVSPEELVSDEDYTEIIEDIKEECGKFGTVEEVKIPRPIATEKGKIDAKASESVADLGKVFVLFDKPEETVGALRAIAGRQFGGRVCICAYASEEVFLD